MAQISSRTLILEIAKHLSLSEAARALGVTQSAISQRLKSVEHNLGQALFIRSAKGLSLTPFGARLQRFYKSQESHEQEFFGRFIKQGKGLSGKIAVGAYPSVARSLVIRSLGPLLRANPSIEFDLVIRQSHELPPMIESGLIDIALIDIPLTQAGLIVEDIGEEEYVEIESSKYITPKNLYLDLDYRDPATWAFFRAQGRVPANLKRAFMSDVYAIINGVEEGIGRAVMPRHLLESFHQIKIVKNTKVVPFKISLVTLAQPMHLKLHQAVIDQIKKGARKL